MATRRLALMGAALGPWVRTASVRSPFLKIDGLKEGSCVMLKVQISGDEDYIGCYTANGTHEVAISGGWMQASCDPPCKTVICEVISKEAA